MNKMSNYFKSLNSLEHYLKRVMIILNFNFFSMWMIMIKWKFVNTSTHYLKIKADNGCIRK